MKYCVLMLVLALSGFSRLCAQASFEQVKGLASREIYDLHVDKKGYLWVAHSLGLSRYDGLNFSHFIHPGQVTLRTTDIVEDEQGRIWWHNFSGQIYYIEKGQIKYLDAYKYLHENHFQRMALCGNELLVTSQWGLFVCNTVTLTSRYIPFAKTPVHGSASMAILDNKAIIYDNARWYLYESVTGMKEISADKDIALPKGNTFYLQTATFRDTLFLTANPSGTLQKLVLRENHLKNAGKNYYGDYINSVTINDKAWVHTRNCSRTTDGTENILASNLTDIITGKEGNTWYSSLQQGLMVKYRPTPWKIIHFPIDPDDHVRSLNVGDGYFFAGTQKGNLVLMEADSGKALWRYNLFNGDGSIDFIRYYKDHLFLVGSSANTYMVNPVNKKIKNLLPFETIVDVDFDSSSLYLATTRGFFLLPYPGSSLTLKEWKQAKQKAFPFYQWNQNNGKIFLFSPQSAHAVRYSNTQQLLFISTKNGLLEMNKKGIFPFQINSKAVFASSLWYKNDRLYIATINDGLWIRDKKKLKHFTTANYLFSNTIIRLKVTGDHLWLFQNTGIQVFDTQSDQVLQHIDLPVISGNNVFDVAEKDGYAYLTTAKGIYKIRMDVSVKKNPPEGMLDYVVINNRDTALENITLQYHQNDLQFFFSSPSYYDPAAVYFKYRMKGADNEWQVTKPDERMLRYSSLMPGEYTFEIIAVNKYSIQQPEPIRFRFTIQQPWWNTWWFLVLVNALVVLMVYLAIRTHINQKLKVELVRRRIAQDLHDDIGATLSSLNIYAEMAQEDTGGSKYLDRMRQNISDVVSRLDDLVWSINPRNDTMEQLMQRIQHTALPLLEAAGIQCQFTYDKRILNLKIGLGNKRNVYLLLKEMVNNVTKHARCTNCHINMEYHKPYLILSVQDNGIGFVPEFSNKGRNGLANMQYRAKQMNGNVQIDSVPQNGTFVKVVLKP